MREFYSFFLESIFGIITCCSKPKMFWIYARSNITFMANIKTFWYKTINNLIRKPMSLDMLSKQSKISVPTAIFSPIPKPASRRFFNVFKKSNDWITSKFSDRILVMACSAS